MSRLMLVLGMFLMVVFGVRAEGLGDNKEGAEARKEVQQYGEEYDEYDEATIKDKIIEKYLYHLDSEVADYWVPTENTLYDTKHGAILSVAWMDPEEVEALYKKRLKRKGVRAECVFLARNVAYRDSKCHYDGCVSFFVKI